MMDCCRYTLLNPSSRKLMQENYSFLQFSDTNYEEILFKRTKLNFKFSDEEYKLNLFLHMGFWGFGVLGFWV